MKQTAMQNFAKAARNIRYSKPINRSKQSGTEVKKKKRMREFFLPRDESAVHQATNIVGISTKIPQYNCDISSSLPLCPSILFF